MESGAVTLSNGVERLSKKLVKIGARNVEITSVDVTVKRRPDDTDCFSGTIQTHQGSAKLVIHAGESVRGRMNRRAQVGNGLVVLLPGNQQHPAKVMMRAPIAAIETVTAPVLDRIGKLSDLAGIAGG